MIDTESYHSPNFNHRESSVSIVAFVDMHACPLGIPSQQGLGVGSPQSLWIIAGGLLLFLRSSTTCLFSLFGGRQTGLSLLGALRVRQGRVDTLRRKIVVFVLCVSSCYSTCVWRWLIGGSQPVSLEVLRGSCRNKIKLKIVQSDGNRFVV